MTSLHGKTLDVRIIVAPTVYILQVQVGLYHSQASLVSSVGRVVGPLTGCYWIRILVWLNYDLYGFLHINSRLYARLNNQLSHPIPISSKILSAGLLEVCLGGWGKLCKRSMLLN